MNLSAPCHDPQHRLYAEGESQVITFSFAKTDLEVKGIDVPANPTVAVSPLTIARSVGGWDTSGSI